MIFIRGLRGKCCAQSQHWLDMSSWDLSLSPQHAATCSAWPSGQHESVQTDPGEPVGHERIHHMCEEPWMIFGWFSRQSWLTNPPQKKRAKGIKRIQGGNLISCFSFIFNFGTFPPVVLASKEPFCVWNVCLKMQSSLHRRQSSTWDDREQLGPGQWAQFGHYQPCLQRQGQGEWQWMTWIKIAPVNYPPVSSNVAGTPRSV